MSINAVSIAALPPGSPEWLALRRTGIGGSDAAAVLGLSPWMTPYELWLDKRGELPSREDTPPMAWGRRLEPLVRQAYADATGSEVMMPRATFRSEAHPWMLANLDGMASGRLVECKTARTAQDWGEPGTDEIPFAYLLQCQHYMTVVTVSVTDVAVLIGGNDFRIYEVPADRELQDMLVEAEAQFWHRVVHADPPEPEGLEDTRRRYGALPVKGAVVASEKDIAAWATLHEAEQHQKDLEAVEAECKAHLMRAMGEAGDVLVDREGKPLVTWKLAKAPERFDVAAFALEHPELHGAYVRPGTASRRFLLKA